MPASTYEKLALLNVLKDWLQDITPGFNDITNKVGYVSEDEDTDFWALSQTLEDAGSLSLEDVTMTATRTISLTSANNLSAVTFTVVGKDHDGADQSESLTGPNASTVYTTKEYSDLTSIASSAAAADIEAGFGEISSDSLYETYDACRSYKGSIPSVDLNNALASIRAETQS